ncbi:interferon alpha-inducible protein 27-like protein 2A [Callorhinchus milii]|uniref:Interferon alpha-inducible protein 6-like protein n=1 Tax=Callorhinchus milii TaxID=7868 RepID=V9LCS1_CALMI|nr:interferon alpha-inducible protein 27-like protein 2A [Callorhinchus milii]|eukprot:gi/632976118/ref/XP_007904617.1/ PREDICTED: interferon alpha-inducible protein 6 [Callorhinchus milii]
MAQQALSLFIMYLLFSSTFAKAEEDEEGSCGIMDALPYMVIGAGAAAYGGPLIVGALGFTGKGIAAKSFASVMMKVSATLGGGGVARGGMVAILQSLGATGSTYGWLGTGAQSGYQIFQRFFCRGNEKSKKPSSSYSSD